MEGSTLRAFGNQIIFDLVARACRRVPQPISGGVPRANQTLREPPLEPYPRLAKANDIPLDTTLRRLKVERTTKATASTGSFPA